MSEIEAKEQRLLPEYNSPPVTEVICGIAFKSLDNFTAAHVGLLWSKFQPDFPKVEEYAPLASPIEIFEGQPFQGQMQFTTVPPLPRDMFISPNGNFIVQVQRDRFIFNWRKLEDDNAYPRYGTIIKQFRDAFSIFDQFTTTERMELEPIQYELTYINQIPQGNLWEVIGDLGKIFPNIQLSFDGLILRAAESTHWRTSFLLPDQVGRLHVSIRTNAVRTNDGTSVVVFELTARGMSKETTVGSRDEWFDIAREWIVKGFTDFTSHEAQTKLWRKIQ